MLTQPDAAARKVVAATRLPSVTDAGAFAECLRRGVAPCFGSEPGAEPGAEIGTGLLDDPEKLRYLLMGAGAGLLFSRGVNVLVLLVGIKLAQAWLDGRLQSAIGVRA